MYCTTAQIASLIKPAQIGVGNCPDSSALEDLIARKAETIDGYCRDRYTVPFSPVPKSIGDMCLALVLGDIIPIIYKDNKTQVDDARAAARQAIQRLEAIQATKFSVEAEDNASQGMGGQIYTTTPSADRIFDIDQQY
jgi:phage gp36-like protein